MDYVSTILYKGIIDDDADMQLELISQGTDVMKGAR